MTFMTTNAHSCRCEYLRIPEYFSQERKSQFNPVALAQFFRYSIATVAKLTYCLHCLSKSFAVSISLEWLP